MLSGAGQLNSAEQPGLMKHCHKKLLEEANRILERPGFAPPPASTCLEVVPFGDRESYCNRLRRVIHSAVSLSRTQDFDNEVLDGALVPEWFALLTDNASTTDGSVPTQAREGAAAYFRAREEDELDLQEWLFMFDPELRSWSWWDLVEGEGASVLLYVDTGGETVVPFAELWWAVYACGAREAYGPFLFNSES